jgi:hypothetical protein
VRRIHTTKAGGLRKAAAGLFLLAVMAAIPAVMLAWGRVGFLSNATERAAASPLATAEGATAGQPGERAEKPTATSPGRTAAAQNGPPAIAPSGKLGRVAQNDSQARAPGPQEAEVIPPEGGEWPVNLGGEDEAYLMQVALEALSPAGARAGTGGSVSGNAAGSASGPAAAPPACVSQSNAPVFVTVYAARTAPRRAMAQQSSLAETVKAAAKQILQEAHGAIAPTMLRVRIDVLREARPFPAEKRLELARREFGAPFGLALNNGSFVFFLPADAVSYPAETNEGILEGFCRQAGLDAASWRRPDLKMWRLEATSFVNGAPGKQYVLPCARGLTPVGDLTVSKLLRACRLAGDYLVHVQREDGSYLSYVNPTGGLRGGCDSVSEQAAVAGALAELCGVSPRPEYLRSCHEALSYVIRATDCDTFKGKMMFTRRQEVCRVVWEMEATAQALEAMCRYRHASGLSQTDSWMAGLAEFLLYMERDDGLFELKYDAETQSRTTPKAGAGLVTPQAKAAVALSLAYRELQTPRYLAAAQKALDRLLADEESRKQPYSAEEARWLVSAARQVSALAPGEEGERYLSWVGRIAAARRKCQLAPGDVPWPDLVGGTLVRFPPTAGATADDLVVFASACIMDPLGEGDNILAARRAAGYLVQLQYLPENSYYLPDPEASLGGLREKLNGNIIRVQTMESALRGLVMLFQLEVQGMAKNDRESQDRRPAGDSGAGQ